MHSDIFSPGQILNNTYEIIRVLGRGGTGEVYLARNQIVERDVAIKALNIRFSGNADYVELIKREEQMRNIINDAVVRYSECSRSDAGHVFLVMDYVEGPSLNEVMLERRLDDRESMIVAHRVLEGLVATHEQGIVHRDLSPDNVILRGGKPERATIIDFGIAKDTAAGARTIVGNEFAGKYEYAAPEQLDGKSDYRADLYGLGALLLAAARQEVPNVGSSPGEVVRFKRDPLDTSGIKPPLKDLLDWLTAPDPAKRPQSAAEALTRLDGWLKPDSHARKTRRAAATRRNAPVGLIAAGVVALLAGGGAWLWSSGAFGPAALPEAVPYRLNASVAADGSGSLSGNAPDPDIAAALRAAFADATGITAPEDALSLAAGMPEETWPDNAADLMLLSSALDRWELAISDNSARISGLAPDAATRAALRATLDGWQDEAGMSVQTSVDAGPESLDWATLEPVLAQAATCGPLRPPADQPTSFGLRDRITVLGDLASAGDAQTIQAEVAPVIGDRELRIDATVLNEDLCSIRSVLPSSATGGMSLWLGKGGTGEAVMNGVFSTGENPVVDVQIPASVTGASLWVMVVDNTGRVFHVLPNINQPETSVEQLGSVDSGVRRIRVLWSIDEVKQDNKRLGFRVTEDNHGKSEVIAILSTTPLFDMRRPRDESVQSQAKALAETLRGREGQIIGMASRIIDARP
ncbi:Serine/threonine protein kinase [Paracoccus isoporae]|uniref:Serine/threonine protein kinase n=1 Tax=Paracoccus isoporae TaxID=591205 RepID=A0A1G7D9E6_9RHOB|nr:serine/threonine-protein kinase [Paracoccus isoporae]SDE48244.1 Serine/threonine protein kinase [Paracoccus isoporae]